jgi:hypothetical protein
MGWAKESVGKIAARTAMATRRFIVVPPMKSVELLAEIEDVIRSMPPKAPLRHNSPENHSWLGHAIAAIGLWDSVEGTRASNYVDASASVSMRETKRGYHGLMVLLNQARSNLRMQTIGPVNLAIGQGFAFNYFDEMRKIIALAQADILFIDPYLDTCHRWPRVRQSACSRARG